MPAGMFICLFIYFQIENFIKHATLSMLIQRRHDWIVRMHIAINDILI